MTKKTELGNSVNKPEEIVGLKIQVYKNDPSREIIKTMEEYFKFLKEYWSLFPPPESRPKKIEYKLILL